MQEQIILVCATLLVFAESESVGGVRFGPNDCATLTRASTGSCLFRTDCDGEDIHSLPFIMDCVHADNSIVRHSFGQGGFDTVEEYDTEVKCARCQLPKGAKSAQRPSLRPKPAEVDVTSGVDDAVKSEDVSDPMSSQVALHVDNKNVTRQVENRKAKDDEKDAKGKAGEDSAVSKVAKYGPKDCVSTYRAKNGHCVMKTSCKGVDLSGYEFGLLCVESGNKSTRHLFGQESFDDVETFDTLIRCEECLAVDTTRSEQAARGASGGSSSTLTKLTGSLKNLTSQMTVMAGSLEKLEKKVFNNSTIKDQLKALADKKTAATTSANVTKAPAADPSAAAPANKSLLHRHSHRVAAAPADKYLLRSHLHRDRRLRHKVRTVRHHRSSATHEVKLTTAAKAAKQSAMKERAAKRRAAKRAAAAKYAAKVRAAKKRAAKERAKKERAAKEKAAAEKAAKEEAAKEQVSKEQEADEEGEENTSVDESTEGASDSEQSDSAVEQSADEAKGSQEQGEEEKSSTTADESTEATSDSEQSGSADVQSTDEAEGSQEE